MLRVGPHRFEEGLRSPLSYDTVEDSAVHGELRGHAAFARRVTACSLAEDPGPKADGSSLTGEPFVELLAELLDFRGDDGPAIATSRIPAEVVVVVRLRLIEDGGRRDFRDDG